MLTLDSRGKVWRVTTLIFRKISRRSEESRSPAVLVSMMCRIDVSGHFEIHLQRLQLSDSRGTLPA
jgi:hypothetical protein